MKKLKRKTSVMFLILFCMVVMGTALLQTVRADESDFVIDENGVLTKYKGSGGDVVIPDGVTAIGDWVFYNYSNLSSISIPDSVISIGDWAFSNCSNLTSIIVNQNNPKFLDIDGVLFDKKQTLLIYYPMGKTEISYTVPNNVSSIKNHAFAGCSSLTSIAIPDSIISIGDSAFANSSLTNITIPNSVTSIGSYAFKGCDKLTSIYIYNDNVSISDDENTLGNKDITTLYANKGSTTEAYANKYGYQFIELLPETKPLESISLNKPTITLDIGRTSLLSVLYNPADTTDSKSVKWSSSNPEIAIVYSNGKVKAISTGTATITATVGDKTATCTVTVK